MEEMDAKQIEFDLVAPVHHQPNRRRWLEESLRRYGLLLMLLGATMVLLIIGCTSANPEHALLGFSLLLLGFVLLAFSEFRGAAAAERFTVTMVGALDDFFGQH
jgi:uncharacterized membrane protein